MAFQSEKQTQAPGGDKKVRPEEELVPEQRSFGVPNSLIAAMPIAPPADTPNSVMREMLSDRQIPAAEDEADRLSAGIRFGSPNSVRKQMGQRLDADFSSVRFHANAESVRGSDSLGARAYTRGSDIYFGRGGFDPMVAAHELVHTVQQGAVPGRVSQSVSFGTVQRLPKWLLRLKRFFRRSKDPSVLPRSASEPPQDSAPAAPAVRGLNSSLLANVRNDYTGHASTRVASAPPADASFLDHVIEDYEGSEPAAAAAAAAAEPDVPVSGTGTVPKPHIELPDTPPPAPSVEPEEEDEEGSSTASLSAKSAAPIQDHGEDVAPVRVEARKPVEDSDEGSSSASETTEDELSETDAADDFSESEDDDEELEEEDTPLIDQQINQYITAHNNAYPRRPIRQDAGGRGSSGNHWKQAADLMNAGSSAFSLFNAADKAADLPSMGGIDAKHSSASYTDKDAKILGGEASLLGAGAAAVSTVTNAVDTYQHAKNISQGENPVEMIGSGTKTLASASSLGSNGISFLDTVGAGVSPALDAVPFLQMGTGAFNGVVGFGSGIRHRYHLHRIHDQQRELEKRMSHAPAAAEEESRIISVDDPEEERAAVLPEPPEPVESPAAAEESVSDRGEDAQTPAERRARRRYLKQILHQAESVEERKRTGGTLQGAQGAVAFGGGLASVLTGPLMPAASAAVGGASAGLALGRFAYEKGKKAGTRERVIAEELGIDWHQEMKLVRENVTNGQRMLPMQARRIILKAHGFEKGTRHEAYSHFTAKRANFLMDQIESEDEDADIAEKAINALGVHRRKGRYQPGARQILAEHLM